MNSTSGAGRTPVERRHPIGVVARRTGLSLHVLRAWERRYEAVTPVRTGGGQRQYTEADIARLQLLRDVTDAGHSISRVVHLPDEELRALAEAGRVSAVVAPVSAGARLPEVAAQRARAAALAAGERLDGEAVYSGLMVSVVAMTPPQFLEQVLGPLLLEVGERWHAGRLGPAQEHVVSDAARRVLWWMLHAYEKQEAGRVVLVTTPSGEHHELGAMMAAVTALDEGCRVVYPGCSLPASEIVSSARRLGASLVLLSVINRGDVSADVQDLVATLPPGVEVLAGGTGALAQRGTLERRGARVLPDLAALREALRHDADVASEVSP